MGKQVVVKVLEVVSGMCVVAMAVALAYYLLTTGDSITIAGAVISIRKAVGVLGVAGILSMSATYALTALREDITDDEDDTWKY